MRVLIVDDHAVVRLGLRQILTNAGRDFTVVEAASGAEALTASRLEPLDMVFLDVSLPDQNGLDVLVRLKSEFPALPVLILSMHAEEQYAIRALRAGASGYLTKESAPDQLILAIDRVLAGGHFLSPSLAHSIALDVALGHHKAPHERLSEREFQIFRLIATGTATAAIAEQLCLSAKTISTYRLRILQKMELRSTADLIQYAIRHSFVD